MKRVYISRSRGYAWLVTIWRWDVLFRRRVAGEKWHTRPPVREAKTPLLEGDAA